MKFFKKKNQYLNAVSPYTQSDIKSDFRFVLSLIHATKCCNVSNLILIVISFEIISGFYWNGQILIFGYI